MILVKGRGQLGEALKAVGVPGDGFLYHTWNALDKSEDVQAECFRRFKKFREEMWGRIVLISTHSEKDNPYVHYKRKAETLADGVIRLPILIGKGVFQRFRDEEAEAWGDMDVIEVAEAVNHIVEYCRSGRSDILTVKGYTIPARIVRRLILYGKYGV